MITDKDIRTALKNNELVYYYQPKVSMITGKIVGAEVLARWIKPHGIVIPPYEFIPVAEKSGLITQITLYLFKTLVKIFPVIYRLDPYFNISFNVSADDLFLDDLTNEIINSIKDKKIPPNCLDIEITESKLIKSEISVRKNMDRLVDAEIGIAMDDFGNGYSSLNVLADYPFTSLKLDYELIKGVLERTKKMAIIKAAIRMAHLLDISIIAEGVENYEQYILLQDMGCTIAQGFWISRPLPFNQFLDFIRQNNAYPASIAGQLHMIHIDHILWYRKIVRHVVRKFRSDGYKSAQSIKAGKKCKFNKQFYKKGQSVLQGSLNNALMEEIESLHGQIHDEAEKIIYTCESADKKEGKNIANDYDVLFYNFNKLHWELVKKIEYAENIVVSGIAAVEEI